MYETGNACVGQMAGSGRLDNYNLATAAPVKLGLAAHHQELRDTIEETSKRLHQLEARLDPILIPTPPLPGAPQAGNSPTPLRSPLLHASFDASSAVHGLIRHIESLLNRIEL